MLLLMIVPAILLALITTVEAYHKTHPLIQDPHDDMKWSRAAGDVVNVTECFCQTPNYRATQNLTFGYYYLVNYWNYHLERDFSISWNCITSKKDLEYTPLGPKSQGAQCLEWLYSRGQQCQSYEKGNSPFQRRDIFCYALDASGNDVYTLNQERRVLPLFPRLAVDDQVRGVCESHCKDHVGDMEFYVFDAEITNKTYQPFGVAKVTSQIKTYANTMNICGGYEHTYGVRPDGRANMSMSKCGANDERVSGAAQISSWPWLVMALLAICHRLVVGLNGKQN